MTGERRDQIAAGIRAAFRSLLIALVAALGTHLVDVIKVKDRVDAMQEEQIINSRWRVEDQARWQQFIDQYNQDKATELNGQRVLLNCLYSMKHHLENNECDWELWQRRRNSYKGDGDGAEQ